MSPVYDQYLDVLQNIEAGLKQLYDLDPSLTDRKVVIALDNAKIAVKKAFGFAQNEKVSDDPELQDVTKWCVTIGNDRIGNVKNLTLKEYTACIDKVRRSVERHATSGRRGYYEFIKDFL